MRATGVRRPAPCGRNFLHQLSSCTVGCRWGLVTSLSDVRKRPENGCSTAALPPPPDDVRGPALAASLAELESLSRFGVGDLDERAQRAARTAADLGLDILEQRAR